MKVGKKLIFCFLNILIGYISARYLLFSTLVIQNTLKGPHYYNPEGEGLRWIGVVMLMFWIFLVYLINVGLGKLLSQDMKIIEANRIMWNNILFCYLPIAVCIILGVIYWYYI